MVVVWIVVTVASTTPIVPSVLSLPYLRGNVVPMEEDLAPPPFHALTYLASSRILLCGGVDTGVPASLCAALVQRFPFVVTLPHTLTVAQGLQLRPWRSMVNGWIEASDARGRDAAQPAAVIVSYRPVHVPDALAMGVKQAVLPPDPFAPLPLLPTYPLATSFMTANRDAARIASSSLLALTWGSRLPGSHGHGEGGGQASLPSVLILVTRCPTPQGDGMEQFGRAGGADDGGSPLHHADLIRLVKEVKGGGTGTLSPPPHAAIMWLVSDDSTVVGARGTPPVSDDATVARWLRQGAQKGRVEMVGGHSMQVIRVSAAGLAHHSDVHAVHDSMAWHVTQTIAQYDVAVCGPCCHMDASNPLVSSCLTLAIPIVTPTGIATTAATVIADETAMFESPRDRDAGSGGGGGVVALGVGHPLPPATTPHLPPPRTSWHQLIQAAVNGTSQQAWSDHRFAAAIARSRVEMAVERQVAVLVSRALRVPLAPPPPLPYPASLCAASMHNPASTTIAFVTYELSPATEGGAGVVTAGLALDLVLQGWHVIILAYMSRPESDAWAAYAKDFLATAAPGTPRMGAVTVFNVEGDLLAGRAPWWEACSPSIYVRRPIMVAVALAEAYARTPFDTVELFDYNGIGYELLRQRIDAVHPLPWTDVMWAEGDLLPGATACTAGRRGTLEYYAAAHGGGASGAFTYLPLHVQIVVRAHGTIQAIDEVERVAVWTAELDARYLMEHLSLQAADMVLVQTVAMHASFGRVYRLPHERLMLAAPPMARVFHMLAQQSNDTATAATCRAWVVRNMPQGGRVCMGVMPGVPCVVFFVLGKLQGVKSPETVAAAWASLVSRYGTTAELHIVFQGYDAMCHEHGQRFSKCVAGLVPPPHHVGLHILPPAPRTCLPTIVDALSPTLAIMASEFETFNLAAHELAHMGIPLLVSDIPTFVEFFPPPHAAIFRAGNASSLLAAMEAATQSIITGRVLPKPSVTYADPVAPYFSLPAAVAAARGCPGHLDGRLVARNRTSTLHSTITATGRGVEGWVARMRKDASEVGPEVALRHAAIMAVAKVATAERVA